MSLELIYTSAPKGIKPGSSGFCTVAMTQGMPAQLIDRLEALSGYRQLFAPQDPQAGLNPAVCSHLRISVTGRNYHVLSRVCASGLDYSQRANKFAYHVALDNNELPPAGPAWLLAMPGYMASGWDQSVRALPPRGRPPNGAVDPAICHQWQQATGDAGWGGAMIDALKKNPRAMVTLIFRPGTDPLPLVAESLALLPPNERWATTFSTYFTKLPAGVDCRWRCVVEGSPEAKIAAGMVVDLSRPMGQPPPGEFVTAARTGQTRRAEPSPRAVQAERPNDLQLAQLLDGPRKSNRAVPAPADSDDWPGSLDFLSEAPSPPRATSNANSAGDRRFRTKEPAKWPYFVGALTASLLVALASVAITAAFHGAAAAPRESPNRAPETSVNPPKRSLVATVGGHPLSPEGVAAARKVVRATAIMGTWLASRIRIAQRITIQDFSSGLRRTDAVIRAQLGRIAAADEARRRVERDLADRSDSLDLPDLRTGKSSVIGEFNTAGGFPITLKFFPPTVLPSGIRLTTDPTQDSAKSLRVMLHAASQTVPPVEIARFSASEGKIQFGWESGAWQSRSTAVQVLNCALQVSIGCARRPCARTFSLRSAEQALEPLELGKAMQGDDGQRLEFKINNPPSNGARLGLELDKEANGDFVRNRRDDSSFVFGELLHFTVVPVISDTSVSVRVRYDGIRIAWKFLPDDPARKLVRADGPTRADVRLMTAFIDHFQAVSSDLGNQIAQAKQGPHRDETLISGLTAKQKFIDDDRKDAQSLEDLLRKAEAASYGFRLYCVVQCGDKPHKIWLLSSRPPDASPPAQAGKPAGSSN